MFNYISFGFYYAIYRTIKLILWVVLATLPTVLVEDFVCRLFARNWKIKISNGKSQKGQNLYDEKKLTKEIVVHNSKFYKRFCYDQLLGFGESYMDGWWDTDSIRELFHNMCSNVPPRKIEILSILEEKITLALNQQTRKKATEVIDQHYDLGNNLYINMLDENMNYTCAYWKDVKDEDDLEQAQINKMDLIARKLKLKPGMKVLELGCGFGSMAKYLAENYKVSVVGYNISKEQIDYAKKLTEGLPCEFRHEDYRCANGQYDRVYSIGFFEAVGKHNFREYFEIMHRCLKDDGIHLLHSITCKDHSNFQCGDFIDKWIFPNGVLPYPDEYFTYSDGLFFVEDVQNLGPNYAKTLAVWHRRFNQNWPKIKDEFGPKLEGKFFRMWNYYLQFCAAVFDYRQVNVYQVVYSKEGLKEGYDAPR